MSCFKKLKRLQKLSLAMPAKKLKTCVLTLAGCLVFICYFLISS